MVGFTGWPTQLTGKAREGEKEAMVRELEEFTILADEFKSDAATRKHPSR